MASIKYKDNGTYKDIVVKVGDTSPIGLVADYDGTEVPNGWEEVTEITELLGNTGLTQGSSYQLSDNVTNYKYIIIVLATGSMFQNASRQYIPLSQIADYTTDYRCALSLFQSTSVFVFADFYFDAVNSIKCNRYTKGTTGWNGSIRVYGIK
jgi:hypothetical protein